jgi:hypothetical protein
VALIARLGGQCCGRRRGSPTGKTRRRDMNFCNRKGHYRRERNRFCPWLSKQSGSRQRTTLDATPAVPHRRAPEARHCEEGDEGNASPLETHLVNSFCHSARLPRVYPRLAAAVVVGLPTADGIAKPGPGGPVGIA